MSDDEFAFSWGENEYPATFFVNKFKKIPEELWFDGVNAEAYAKGARSALEHCGYKQRSAAPHCEQSRALELLIEENYHIPVQHLDWGIGDFVTELKKQGLNTPKKRMLHVLGLIHEREKRVKAKKKLTQ